MKVFSIYDKDKNFLVAFPSRESAVSYGRYNFNDGWDYDIVEEYLNKSPILYGSPYTPLTNPNPIPCTIPPVISKPPATYPETYPHVWCEGVKA